MPKQTVTTSIKVELTRAGKRQMDLAALLGKPQASISERMTGRVEWRISEVQAIADYLGIPITRLIDVDVPEAVETEPEPAESRAS